MNVVKNPVNLTACTAALILGGIGVLAYSPFDYWFVAYLSAAGLIWAATLENKKTAFAATFAWSISYFCIGVSWVHISMIQFGGVPPVVSYLAVFILACYLGLYNLLFCALVQRFRLTNPLVSAAVFTLTEYLRSVVFTGFPWLQFGYSQIDGPFSRIAPILGVEGLSFFVMALSGCLVLFAKKTEKTTACILTFTALLGLGLSARFVPSVQTDGQKPPMTISLVQGNIEQRMKWDPEYFEHILHTYNRLITPQLGRSDVIILPESAIPALETYIDPILQNLQKAGAEKGSEIIIGTIYENERNELFNSAVVLGDRERPYDLHNSPRYAKHHLVPFGEYVPFGSLLDWMREVFVLPVNLSQGGFIQAPLLAKTHKFNMAICYEVVFGNQMQQNQKVQKSDYLLTITNDAWFGASIGPWQHFQMARMRALELGKPLIRAANTGITAVVEADGKVSHRLAQFEENVLSAQLRPTKGETLFGRFGSLPVYAFSLLLAAAGIVKNRRKTTACQNA